MTGHTPAESTNACPTSPTTDQPELLPVIQADREAALKLHLFTRSLRPGDYRYEGTCTAYRSGLRDSWEMVQAFARHRLTSTTPTLGDMVMVPREPTEAMLTAGNRELGFRYEHQALRSLWSAMLAAAPASPIPISVNGAGEREKAQEVVRDALLDSQFIAGAKAGWNAAQADDPEAALAVLLKSREGHLAGFAAAKRALALSPALDNTAVEGQDSADVLLWANAETCLENAEIAYDDSIEDEDGPVDTVISSGDLGVVIELAKRAVAARNAALTAETEKA